MEIKKAAIFTNTNKKEALEGASQFIKRLSVMGINAAVPEEDAVFLKGAITDNSGVDVAVAFGGDGTVLKAVRLLENKATPILAINYGRVGFLSEAEPEDVQKAFDKVLEGDFRLDKKMLLKANTGNTKGFNALNDISIVQSEGNRALHLDVFIKGSLLYTYSCDGFVVASPTGSTAYSLSLGGPILTPGVEAKVLSPVNPHTLFNKSIVVSKEEPVEIVSKGPALAVLADGIRVEEKTVKVSVGLAGDCVNIVRFKKNHFVEDLKERLFKL